jgi:hypothetical protein
VAQIILSGLFRAVEKLQHKPSKIAEPPKIKLFSTVLSNRAAKSDCAVGNRKKILLPHPAGPLIPLLTHVPATARPNRHARRSRRLSRCLLRLPRAATLPFAEVPPPAAVRLGRRSAGCADRSRGPALLQRVPASVHRQPHALHHRSAARSPSLAGRPLSSVDRGDSPFPTLNP